MISLRQTEKRGKFEKLKLLKFWLQVTSMPDVFGSMNRITRFSFGMTGWNKATLKKKTVLDKVSKPMRPLKAYQYSLSIS